MQHHLNLQPPICCAYCTFRQRSAEDLTDAAVAYEPSPAGAGTLSAMMANGSISRIGNHTACGAVGSNFQVLLIMSVEESIVISFISENQLQCIVS